MSGARGPAAAAWRRLLERPGRVLLVLGALTGALGAAAARVRTDDSLPVWLSADDPELATYAAFRARFGEDNFILAATTAPPADPTVGPRLAALVRDLAALPGAEAALGPDPAGLVGRLLVGDEGMTGVLVTPAADLPPEGRAALYEQVRARLAREPWPFHVAGPEAINHELDLGSQRSFRALFPVVVAVVALVLWVSLRQAAVVAVVLASAGAAIVWTLGALVLAGRALNLVLVVLPALLTVLGTACALHLVSRFLDQEPGPPGDAAARRRAWAAALEASFAPCLLTAVTTAAGFLALCSSGLPPLRDLGWLGAVGVLSTFLLAFTLVPAALSPLARVVPRGARVRRSGAGPGLVLARTARRRAPLLLGLAALLLAGAAAGAARLRAESHILRFFAPDHPLVVATATIEDRLLGLTPLEVWVSGEVQDVVSPAAIAAARALAARWEREEPLVERVISPLDADPRVAGLSPALAARSLRRLLADDGAAGLDPALRHHVRRAGGRLDVRFTVACHTTSSESCHALATRIRADVAGAGFPPGVEVRLTGAVPLLVRIQTLLLGTQVSSFLGSIGLVSLALLLWSRSPALVGLALVPNVLPVLLTLGLMGWAGLPLDVATVTVAGIALGLVVDDTIHFLHHYAGARAAGRSRFEAVTAAYDVTARPIVATTAAVALGFAAFAAAPFRPTRDFGLLVMTTSVSALACDLLLLPALLLLGAREPAPASPAPAVTP